MMTVSCAPQAKDLELTQVEKPPPGVDCTKDGSDLKNEQVRCDVQRTDDKTSCLTIEEKKENVSNEETDSSAVPSVPCKENTVVANQEDANTSEANQGCVSTNKTVKQGRAVSRGRRKSENKEYNQKSQNGGRSRGRKISKSNRDYENSSSNGGNSGADGNGEDNGSDDDDEDDDADEDDDDDDEDDDDVGDEDEDEDDEEESKNEDDDDDISLNGNDKNVKQVKIKQEPPDDQETLTTGLQGFMAGLDGNIPLADLLEKLPNSLCQGDENSSSPALPGAPVTLHGIVCHEIGGVLVVNIKWRNKFYCGSLMDCSRHAWASPRFPAVDGGENEMKMGGKGGKGKRRQKSSSVSSSVGNVNKEATPLKHKLRGRKRGVSGCPPPKSQGFKGMGKRRSKNIDDDDDAARPGKRSCTMKTTVSPQPSPTLIECPEPGCDKKYKHINGLRYHQAHAHLEESNQSDERSASTSPSPVEEFKEPDTKTSFKGRTSRVSARARSVSPSLAAAIASMNEKKNESSRGSGTKKKEIAETSTESTTAKEAKVPKSPIPSTEEDVTMEDTTVSFVESSDKCQQACEHDIRLENDNQKKVDHTKQEHGFKPVPDEQQAAVKNLEKEEIMMSNDSTNSSTHLILIPVCTATTEEIKNCGKVSIKSETPQASQEVWETVIDSGFSLANGGSKSLNMEERISISQVEDVEKALGENSFSSKQSSNQLSIPDMQPVDLRQAVDTGVGLINQLGIEVEDISETEEDIDPGQDSEYTSKDDITNLSTAVTDQTNSGLPFAAKENYLSQKSEVESNKSFLGSDAVTAKVGSSFYFGVKKEKTSTEEKSNKNQDGKLLSQCESKKADLWTSQACASHEKLSTQLSVPLQSNTETKLTPPDDKGVKTSTGGISMEALVSKSISRSAVEPPLINRDAPSMRYKFFECRNYGDDNYDKCIRTADVDQKGNVDSKATLAPIRYPELVRNAANSEPLQNRNDSPLGCEGIRTGLNVTLSTVEEGYSEGKTNKNLSVPTGHTRTRSPIPEAFSRNVNLPDKARVSMETHHSTKSPRPIPPLTGNVAMHLSSSRPGFETGTQSPSTSLSDTSNKVHSATGDRKTPSSPFQPVIVKHEFQSSETTKGIKQEVNMLGFTQSDSRETFMSSPLVEHGKMITESKGGFGLNEPAGSRKSPLPSQGMEDQEKSYKVAARALTRPYPALISRSGNLLAPSLPVGVAHPYPRASDGGSSSSHLKASEYKTSTTVSSVTSVTYTSTSPRPLPSPRDVPTELPQPENKAKQLQMLQVPIPVGEVSPVSLKRSPGPAIHSGLPPVLPIIGSGIKTQASISSHPSIRPGLKASGMNEPMKSERKTETVLREPSPYAMSKSPVPRSKTIAKPSPEGKSPQQLASSAASHPKTRASDDSSREDSEIVVVKEDPVGYGSSKDKLPVAEKERGRRDIRETAAELNFRSHESLSAEQLRNLQFQQQMLQQYYQPFMQAGGAMPLEMLKNPSQLAYMQGMPVDPKAALAAQAQLFQNMMMLEQEKQEMHSGNSSGHMEARTYEKKETQKPSDRTPDDRRSDELGIKKAMQGRAPQDENEFRRFPSQSESLQYSSPRGSSPKVIQHKLSADEPPEKKSRVDDTYERERELERLKYKREEEFLQKQKHLQQISMYKQLENDLQNKQLSSSFRKRQATPEKSERHGNLSREDERVENRAEGQGGRDLVHHHSQESAPSTAKEMYHSFEAENSHGRSSSGQGSPRSQVIKSQSLSAPRSPRPSRSPVPASRYKENSPASDEKRDGSNSLPANFMPTQFQAYLSQLNFDPSAGQLPYGAHQMLVGPQFSLPPGLVMSMPISSHGESSAVTSMASASRERETRSPYRGTERDRSSTTTTHSSSQARASTAESHERLQKLKDSTEKETRHSPVMYQEERVRNRSTASEQNVSPKASSRSSDFKGENNSLHAHPSIISNNLAVSRMAGHMDALTEEEIIRRQRLAEFSDPSQALRMGYYVPPGLIGQLDPAYAASMMQSSSQHISRGMEHYMTKRL